MPPVLIDADKHYYWFRCVIVPSRLFRSRHKILVSIDLRTSRRRECSVAPASRDQEAHFYEKRKPIKDRSTQAHSLSEPIRRCAFTYRERLS
jgi:hypothetical protein